MSIEINENEEIKIELELDERYITLTEDRIISEGEDVVMIHLDNIKSIERGSSSHDSILKIFGGKSSPQVLSVISEDDTVLTFRVDNPDIFVELIRENTTD
jgi:hypothetical protein